MRLATRSYGITHSVRKTVMNAEYHESHLLQRQSDRAPVLNTILPDAQNVFDVSSCTKTEMYEARDGQVAGRK